MIDDLDPINKQKVEEMILQVQKVAMQLASILGEDKVKRNITKSLEKMVKQSVISDDDKNEILQKIGYGCPTTGGFHYDFKRRN